MKITFMGAGSTIFLRNVLGDCMCTESLRDSEMALYDIDEKRLNESYLILSAINKSINNNRARIKTYLGPDNRKAALKDASFIINAIQVGGYIPSTKIDFEIPKKYGLRQTIADTLGIGGIMRGLRTISVLEDFAKDIEEVAPNALFINYTNPMAILTGYMQRYTNVNTIGLCHSVQGCSSMLLEKLGMTDKIEGRQELIAGINHMGWLLELRDKYGNDLYPEIRKRAKEKNENEIHDDMVRFEYINRFGYYCTESSEHNAEYNPYFIKSNYPDLIKKYNIPLDEYMTRCVTQIDEWNTEKEKILHQGKIGHTRSIEYASYIMEALVTNSTYYFGGNVINNGIIENLPKIACVEVPCKIENSIISPIQVRRLPEQLAALNRTNINPQLLTIKAAVSKKREDIYQAAMLDPHTAAQLSLDDIVKMCDELILAHGDYMKDYN